MRALFLWYLSVCWWRPCPRTVPTYTLRIPLCSICDSPSILSILKCLVAYKVCPGSFHLQKVEEGNAKRVMERGLSDERLRPTNYYTNDEFPSVQTRNQFVLLDILLSCCVVLLRPRDCLSPGAVPCAYCNHHIVCAGHIKMLRNPFNGARKVHIADGGRKGPI